MRSRLRAGGTQLDDTDAAHLDDTAGHRPVPGDRAEARRSVGRLQRLAAEYQLHAVAAPTGVGAAQSVPGPVLHATPRRRVLDAADDEGPSDMTVGIVVFGPLASILGHGGL
jgi:hypothetical protein